MKNSMIRKYLAFAIALFPGFLAAETITLSGVHLCCKGCIRGAEKAATSTGATATVDFKKKAVVITAADAAAAQKAVDALAKGGYYGKSSNPSIAIKQDAPDKKVSSCTVSGVHLCCKKCVRALDKVIDNLDGAESHTAVSQHDTFKVKGDFSLKALQKALHAEGLSGTISE
jgi:hypothetical protein